MKLGFIGMGNMATAIARGILSKGIVSADEVYGSSTSEEHARAKRAELGINMTTDNLEVVRNVDILFLSVKPQHYEGVIAEIRDTLKPYQVVVTIAPGKTISWLEAKFQNREEGDESVQARPVKIVRCMPNTPALVGEGFTSYCPNAKVTDGELEIVESMLDCFGKRMRLSEGLIDAASAVGGSAPAFAYAFIEALAAGGVAEGLPRAAAYEVAAQTVLGSAKMVLETGQHPGALKDAVCSPAGSTIKGMEVLEKAAFRGSVIDAVRTTAAAARGL